MEETCQRQLEPGVRLCLKDGAVIVIIIIVVPKLDSSPVEVAMEMALKRRTIM